MQGLASALVLVAPAGFSEADRRLWLKAASMTLKDVPEDLLIRGIEAARLTADHPSKIIPAIMAEIRQAWEWRKQDARRSAPLALPAPAEVEKEDDGEPFSLEQVLAMPGYIRDLGVARGFIAPEQLEAVKAAPAESGMTGETE